MRQQHFSTCEVGVLLALLISCPDRSALPKPELKINEKTHQTSTTSKSFESDLCASQGSATSKDYSETFTSQVEGSIGADFGTEVIKAKLAAKYGEGKQTTMTYHFAGVPGRRQRVKITWTWEEWAGDLSAGRSQGAFIARLPIKYEDVVIDVPCIDISGEWKTPFNNLTYHVTQDGNRYTWVISQSGVSGSGTIEGKTLVGELGGQQVVYEVWEYDAAGNVRLLHTTNATYRGVILFKDCVDFRKYLKHVGEFLAPQTRDQVYNLVKSVPNPTCPNAVP